MSTSIRITTIEAGPGEVVNNPDGSQTVTPNNLQRIAAGYAAIPQPWTDAQRVEHDYNTLAALAQLNPQWAGPKLVAGVWVDWPTWYPGFVLLSVYDLVEDGGDGHGSRLPPPLRVGQRDDGVGSFSGHARVVTSGRNGPTSGILSSRAGASNVYEPGPGRPDTGGGGL